MIIAFLLGLVTILRAEDLETEIAADGGSIIDDDGEVFSWDSPDSEDKVEGDTSYNGINIQVYQPQGESPIITLGTKLDDYEDVYCLNFKGLFEAVMYNTAVSQDGTYDVKGGSEVDLADANCTINEDSPTTFTIICTEVNEGILTLTFEFIQDSQGDYGLEYYVSLEGYESVSDQDYKLVMVQSLEECSTQYPYSADSMDSSADSLESENSASSVGESTTESPDTENDDTTEAPESPEATDRRRLEESQEDNDNDATDQPDTESEDEESTESETESNSEDEDDGISSDDSNEYDAGKARFVVDGQAFDNCPSLMDVEDEVEGAQRTAIGSSLVYQSGQKELHIVFDSFNCDLTLDPFVGLDGSKYEGGEQENEDLDDGAGSLYVMVGMVMGLVVMLL